MELQESLVSTTLPIKNLSSLHQMSQAMIARGPDDEGYCIATKQSDSLLLIGGDSSNSNGENIQYYSSKDIQSLYEIPGHLFLAHRRLSIIDLSPFGHQPMCTADGRFSIVFNGEIYNHAEIAAELSLLDVQFRGHCDTEVLLYAYQEWGSRYPIQTEWYVCLCSLG